MSRRLGLRGRTVLVFGLVFAGFAVAAASANYLLLRRAITTGQELPSSEELATALEEVARDRNQPVPEVFANGTGGLILSGPVPAADAEQGLTEPDQLFPLISRIVDTGEPAVVVIDQWMAARIDDERGVDAIEFGEGRIPVDGAEFDQLVLGSLAVLEPANPGVTSDLITYISSLRDETGRPLFSEEIVGDGDICNGLFANCEVALADLGELVALSSDSEFVEMMDQALLLAAERTRDRALTSQLRISALVALISTAVAAGAAWLVTRRMLRPVAEVTTAARQASADNLHRRIDLDGPSDELKNLADTFDDMLARLERSFDSSQRFGSNAAHELKTPLAVMRAEIDASRADPETGEKERALLDRLEAATDRSDRLVNSLLDLARAEGRPPLNDDVDIAAVTTDALLDQAELFSRRDLRVDFQVAEEAQAATVVRGDAALLATLSHNLVENAAKYAVGGSEVEVAVESVGDRLRLRVENRSDPIDVDDPSTLTEPFNRAVARTGVSGHGLGLSIVGAIARAHDAEIEVGFRDGNHGLRVTVDFPALAEPVQDRSTTISDRLPTR